MRDDLPSTIECRKAHEYCASVNARGRVGGSEVGRGKVRRVRGREVGREGEEGGREGGREERRGGWEGGREGGREGEKDEREGGREGRRGE